MHIFETFRGEDNFEAVTITFLEEFVESGRSVILFLVSTDERYNCKGGDWDMMIVVFCRLVSFSLRLRYLGQFVAYACIMSPSRST